MATTISGIEPSELGGTWYSGDIATSGGSFTFTVKHHEQPIASTSEAPWSGNGTHVSDIYINDKELSVFTYEYGDALAAELSCELLKFFDHERIRT